MNFYLIGIKGSGMSALACLLHDLGHHVLGYDDSTGYKFTLEGLNQRHIKVYHQDDTPKKLLPRTIVTYTAAISENHPELKKRKEEGYLVMPYKDVMGFLTSLMKSLCVCGTHGKTTTTLILSKILDKAFGCSYFVGDGTGHGDVKSDLLVIESCEFNRHFLSYHPYNVLLTNIELDHTETYANIEVMIDTFQDFINKAQNDVVLCGDDLNIRKLKVKKAHYYGFNSTNDLVIKNREVVNHQTCFDIYYQGMKFDSYKVNMFGDHLILDCAGAILMSILFGVNKKIIKKEIERFTPPKRRFNETIIGSNVLVDDYAHHPTEIRVTYDSAHQKYPDKKIVAVFLPNTYSRTEALMDDFVKSLKFYDKAYVMDIECDRERQEDYPDISSQKIVEQIKNSEMIDINSVNKLADYHDTVICFMSCANINPMIEKTKELYQNLKK